jgi:hypothetical protein
VEVSGGDGVLLTGGVWAGGRLVGEFTAAPRSES